MGAQPIPIQPNLKSFSGDNVSKQTIVGRKTSFLVYRGSRYVIVPVENIALFCIKFEAAVIICFDKQEFTVNHSLDQIQTMIGDKHFFRLNRQCLINFQAIRDVEHYFKRKLLVNPTITFSEKLLVPKEKASGFLDWLDNR